MRTENRVMRRIARGASVAALAFVWLSLAQAASPAPADPASLPAATIANGGKCVAPTDDMRRNHMNMLLHQRELTVREGLRDPKYSLKNCVDCHADPKTNSVLGPKGFCESCHTQAAVRIDCFECHSPTPQAVATQRRSAPLVSLGAGGSR